MRRRSLVVRALTVLLVAGATVVGAQPVASAAPPWLPAQAVAGTASTVGGAPSSIAVAPDGTAVLGIRTYDGTNYQVAASVRAPGGEFSAPVSLSTPGQATAPLAVIDPQGGATVAWKVGSAVLAAYRPPGGAWSTATVATDVTSSIDLDAGENGGAAIGWYAGSPQRAFVAVRPPGGTAFAVPQPVSSTTDQGPSGIFQVRVAMDAAGTVGAIWTRDVLVSGTSRFLTETAIRPAGVASFSGTGEVRSPTSGSSSSLAPDIVMTSAGRAFAVWDHAQDGEPSRIQYSERAPGGTFGARSTLFTDPSTPATSPRPAISDAGTVVLAWSGASSTVFSAVKTPGGAFSPARAVSGSGVQSTLTAVAISSSEAAEIAWATNSSGDYSLFSSRRAAGGEFGNAVEVARGQAASPITVLGRPSLGVDDQGNATIASQRQSGSPTVFDVVVVDADVTAPVVTSVSAPASAAVGVPASYAATTSDRRGPVSVSWTFGDGGSAAGASVQHTYTAPGVYTATVTATDAIGNRSQASRVVQVAAAPPPAITALRASAKGVLSVTVSTPRPAAVSATARRPATGKGARKVAAVVWGSARSSVAAPGSTTLSLKPTAKARKALRSGAVKVTVTVVVTPAGAPATTLVRTIKVKPVRSKPGRK